MNQTDLNKFDNSSYDPGAGFIKRGLWFILGSWFFHYNNPFNGTKVFLLKLFGAVIGKNVIIKPRVNIKYPWRLTIGNNTWIGENVWIDNLDDVDIGNNVCISQGAFLLCGNHNYANHTFDLMTGKIKLEDGVWIGAKAIVCPGITCHSHSVLTVGSIATSNLEHYSIYQGNPAKKVKERVIN